MSFQVCVKECPKERDSFYADARFGIGRLTGAAIKKKMKPFCADMSQSRWDNTDALALIEQDR